MRDLENKNHEKTQWRRSLDEKKNNKEA